MQTKRAWAGQRLCIFLCLFSCLVSVPGYATASDDSGALKVATQALCGQKIALLGEASTHSDGHTIAFKAQLARRLIEKCQFKAVLFEASYYEFGHISEQARTGTQVTPQAISIALSGLWNRDPAMQPFMQFLAERANKNGLVLAGMDDRWAVAGQTYSNETLPAALAARLPEARGKTCGDVFHQQIYSSYPASDRARVRQEALTCLSEVGAAVPATDTVRLRIVNSLYRSIDRSGSSTAELWAGREQSMFLNFQQIAGDLPADTKIIVWGATVHLAKLQMVDDGNERPCLGSYIHEAFPGRAFTLGFGAQRGNRMPEAPAGSLEALARTKSAAAFMGPRALKKRGVISAGLVSHEYLALDWSRFVDGAVIFREEYPGGMNAPVTK